MARNVLRRRRGPIPENDTQWWFRFGSAACSARSASRRVRPSGRVRSVGDDQLGLEHRRERVRAPTQSGLRARQLRDTSSSAEAVRRSPVPTGPVRKAITTEPVAPAGRWIGTVSTSSEWLPLVTTGPNPSRPERRRAPPLAEYEERDANGRRPADNSLAASLRVTRALLALLRRQREQHPLSRH